MALVMTKRGDLPAEKSYIGKCAKCKSEYTAQRKDLNYESDYRESSWTASCTLSGCNTVVFFTQER